MCQSYIGWDPLEPHVGNYDLALVKMKKKRPLLWGSVNHIKFKSKFAATILCRVPTSISLVQKESDWSDL